MKSVAIMQPTYLPWSGYFGLMQSVDLFIFLDTVQFARRSWQQRNQIKTANGPQFLSVPVLTKGRRDQLIMDVEIEQNQNFVDNHRKSIELNYRKSPFFDDLAFKLLPVLEVPRQRLCELNIDLIMCLKTILNIKTPVIRASELQGNGVKADLLASYCQEVGATEYVSPPGSREYLDESDAFEVRGIPVKYFHFTHPEYPQLYNDFVPYMSCLDLIFNCGDQSRSFINDASAVSN